MCINHLYIYILAHTHTHIYIYIQEGEHDTVDYRMHSLDHNEERISLWHELPLFAVDDDARPTGALNFICEMYVFILFYVCMHV